MKMLDIKSNIDFIKIILAKESFNRQSDNVNVWEPGEKERCRKKYEELVDSLKKGVVMPFPMNIFMEILGYMNKGSLEQYISDLSAAVLSEGKRMFQNKDDAESVRMAFIYQNLYSVLNSYKETIIKRIIELCNMVDASDSGNFVSSDDKLIQQFNITGDNNMVYNSIVNRGRDDVYENISSKSQRGRKYELVDDSECCMVAEESPVYGYGYGKNMENKLDYGLTSDDFDYDKKKQKNYRWISVKESRKPVIGEKYMICGYCYRGVVDYITGIYEGCGNWSTVYDNGNNPEFRVLYWKDIEEIDGIEDEM